MLWDSITAQAANCCYAVFKASLECVVQQSATSLILTVSAVTARRPLRAARTSCALSQCKWKV